MIFTDKPCGSISSWIALQVIPGSTVMVRFSGEKATTRFIPRMSRKRLPSVAICPPMLKRPPPIEIGPEWLRTSSRTSSTVRGVTTRATAMGFSWVMSFTITGSADTAIGHARRRTNGSATIGESRRRLMRAW